MAKSKATISIDPSTWEKAKSTYGSCSERIEELIEADLDVSQLEDVDMVESEINDLEEEKEELEKQKHDLEKEIQRVESELNTAQATLKRLQREKSKESDVLARFKKVFNENDWRKPEDIKQFWVEETSKTKEELFDIGNNQDEN